MLDQGQVFVEPWRVGGSGAFVTDRHPRTAIVERGLDVGKALQVPQVVAGSKRSPAAAHIVRGITATDLELGQNGVEIVLVPVFVGVAEDEIERPRQGRNDGMRIAQARIDELRQPSRLEVGERLAMPAFIDLNRSQRPAGLAERPGNPDPGMSG